MQTDSSNFSYYDGDIRIIRDSLQAAMDAISLMRLAVNDRVKASFDNLIVDNLSIAIQMLNMPIATPEENPGHNYVYEEVLETARAADAAEKTSKRTRKGE